MSSATYCAQLRRESVRLCVCASVRDPGSRPRDVLLFARLGRVHPRTAPSGGVVHGPPKRLPPPNASLPPHGQGVAAATPSAGARPHCGTAVQISLRRIVSRAFLLVVLLQRCRLWRAASGEHQIHQNNTNRAWYPGCIVLTGLVSTVSGSAPS